MEPHGTSAAVSRASQLLGLSVASAVSMISRSAGSFAVRAGQSLNRGSASASAHPSVDRKSTRLNSSHGYISYAVFCLKKKKNKKHHDTAKNERAARYVDHNCDDNHESNQ